MTILAAPLHSLWRKSKSTILTTGAVLAINFTLLPQPLFAAQESGFSAQEQQQFEQWLQAFSQDAMGAGISENTLKAAFKGLQLSDKVLEMDRKQPEFTRTFFEYLNRAVSETRIENGRQNFINNRTMLDQIEKTYGIPGAYLVAFWGMETNYGSYTGYDPIIQSLATLAFDPRRSDFFRSELLAALTILDRGDVELSDMQGSWAGAMGQVQFMPSNYLRYAIDGDGDGKVNLWKSTADALYSAANFLQKLGWEAGQEWGIEVNLPQGFDLSLADNKTPRTLTEWQQLGLKTVDNRPLNQTLNSEINHAVLTLPSDYRGPAFLTFKNFKVIKRWNNSTNYAVGVGYLADQIRYRPQLSKSRPADDKGLNREQVIEIQTLLNQLGFVVGNADGIAGGMTRAGLRAFQKSIAIPADGYPSIRMLNYLRAAFQQTKTEN